MKIVETSISLLEVPGEVALNVGVVGCPLRCKGCHSPYLRNSKNIQDVSLDQFKSNISKVAPFITCINFMGGEWEQDFPVFVTELKKQFKISLYTGFSIEEIKNLNDLDYIKVGPFIKELGGLSSVTTNQKMYKKQNSNFIDITYLFQQGLLCSHH